MAMPKNTTAVVPSLQIESIQSVMPLKMTDPRQARHVFVTDPLASGVFQKRFHIVLYYKKVAEDDSGYLLAGWTKESLGRALSDHPILAGRLSSSQKGEGELVIVSNDSGIRMMEARIPMTLEEFIDMKDMEDIENELVFWKDIDEQNPQYSPLFYIQVTNFQCGGYSVGISCSLLLADPVAMTSFLKKWANIHKTLLSETEMPKLPIFYSPNIIQTTHRPSNRISSSPRKPRSKTMVIRISDKYTNTNGEMLKTIFLSCIEKVENEVGSKILSKIILFVKESSERIKVENYFENEITRINLNFREGLTCANRDDLGAGEIVFRNGNKPTRASCWIDSGDNEGVVVIITPSHVGINVLDIIIAIPNGEGN